MPSKEIIAGLSLSQNFSLLAVIEDRGSEFELLHLAEHERRRPEVSGRSDGDDYWYLSPLKTFLSQHPQRIREVAIAFDGADLFLLTCPIDLTLTQPERNEHLNWEFSHYISDFKPQDYITDVHVLATHPDAQFQNVLAVAVQRSVILGLQRQLRDQGLALGVVDINPFAVETSLFRSHPDAKKVTVLCMGVNEWGIEASLFRNGHLTRYKRVQGTAAENMHVLLKETLDERDVSRIYLHGIGVTRHHEKFLKSTCSLPVELLNPFRRVLISSAFRGFDRYIEQTYRFAAAVGIALRRT